MNFKNFYPRQDARPKQNLYTYNRNSEISLKRPNISHLNKADFNLSENENEMKILNVEESESKKLKILHKSVSKFDGYKSNKSNNQIKTKEIKNKSDLISQNLTISKICYNTVEEKLKLLEDLDTDNFKKTENLGLDRPIVEGTCLDMCPEKERYQRECQSTVSIFEKNEKNQFDHKRAVKEYERCSIDQKESQPHNLRPTDVLQRTMNYLLTQIVDVVDEKVSWGQWYRFLWDRTRSIRKDITQQNLCNVTVINIIESITRFHIFCAAWLCEDIKDHFDPRMNDDHLKNCLQTLKNMYADMPIDSCPNEAEFRSYMIVLNLDKGEMLDEAQKLTSRVFHSPKLTFAISVYQAVSTNNYVRFFRLLEQSDLMLSCVLHRFIVPMRLRALEVINRAYVTNKSTENKLCQMPLSTVIRQLKFESREEALEFCDIVNQKWATYQNRDVIFLNPSILNFDKKQELIRKSIMLVETKQGNHKLSVIFNGGQPVPNCGSLLPECRMVSFDENACYIGNLKMSTKVEAMSSPNKHTGSTSTEVIYIDSSEEDADRESNADSDSVQEIETGGDSMEQLTPYNVSAGFLSKPSTGSLFSNVPSQRSNLFPTNTLDKNSSVFLVNQKVTTTGLFSNTNTNQSASMGSIINTLNKSETGNPFQGNKTSQSVVSNIFAKNVNQPISVDIYSNNVSQSDPIKLFPNNIKQTDSTKLFSKNINQSDSSKLFSNNINQTDSTKLFSNNIKSRSTDLFLNSTIQTGSTCLFSNTSANQSALPSLKTDLFPSSGIKVSNCHLVESDLKFTIQNTQLENSDPNSNSRPIVQPNSFEKEKIDLANDWVEEILSELIAIESKKETEQIISKLQLKDLLCFQIQDDLIIDLVRQIVMQMSHAQNYNKVIVSDEVTHELIEDIVHAHFDVLDEYLANKKSLASALDLHTQKRFFKRWLLSCRDSIYTRRSLTKLAAAPRLLDDFEVCEAFRGKVRKIETDWFVAKNESWQLHPIICRLDRICDESLESPLIPNKRDWGSQIVQPRAQSCMELNQFIHEFVTTRFLNVINMHMGVLELAGAVDPAPEIIITDYNSVIDDLASIIDSTNIISIEKLNLTLPLIDLNVGPEKHWLDWLNSIFSKLELHSNQIAIFLKTCINILNKVDCDQDSFSKTYFHFRLFPWLNIVKSAVLNKLEIVDEKTADIEVVVENNTFCVLPKLHLESTVRELSMKHCLDQCTRVRDRTKVPLTLITVPESKRSSIFKDFRDNILKLQQKIDECKGDL